MINQLRNILLLKFINIIITKRKKENNIINYNKFVNIKKHTKKY